MKRYLLPFMLLALGSLAGCPGTTCLDLKCTAMQTCDENAPKRVCTDIICKTGETFDAATKACKAPAVTCTAPQVLNMAKTACEDPPPPTLGALIERMGRPGVNTALTNPFDVTKNAQGATEASGDTTKDNYNKDGNVAMWTTAWSGYVRQNLAVLDGLDRNCGNQFAAAAMTPRYSLLASVLAGDALHVDTSKNTCAQYLGAEVSAVTVLGGGAALNDCGGRKLDYDVIDTTYSALAAGVLAGVDDGITNDSTFLTAFPFMAAPQ